MTSKGLCQHLLQCADACSLWICKGNANAILLILTYWINNCRLHSLLITFFQSSSTAIISLVSFFHFCHLFIYQALSLFVSYPPPTPPQGISVRHKTVSRDPKPINIHGTSRKQAGPAGEKLQKLMNMLNLRWLFVFVPVCLSLLWSRCSHNICNMLPSFEMKTIPFPRSK